MTTILYTLCILGVMLCATWAYSDTPTQYHIQTDEGKERYFKYQTYTGQYRKEKRLEDGTVVGTYGWVDPNGILLLYDYIADKDGYRIVRTRKRKVPIPRPPVTKKYPVSNYIVDAPPRKIFLAPPPLKSAYRPKPVKYYTPVKYPDTSKLPFKNEIENPADLYNYDANNLVSSPSIPDRIRIARLPPGKRTIDYNLNNQFHYEVVTSDGVRYGRHGYIDPFNILRVFHYVAGPQGLKQTKNAQYVGPNFDTTILGQ